MKTFGERLRELRDKKDFSLRELAEKLNVTAPFLSDIEFGRRYPSEAVLVTLAKFLGTTVEDFKSYDNRAPVKELKQLASSNPAFGIALRIVADGEVTPEDIIKLAEKKKHGK